MKTIKKLGKEYYKPDTNEVDWSKVIGKRCVIDVSINVGESGAYSDFLIEDFDDNTNLLKYKIGEESFWVDMEFYKTWILMFVFEPEEKPIKKSNLSDEMKLLLEKASEDDHKQTRPFYPPQWPKVPTPQGVKCSKCGIDFGNGPIGYVCPNYPCPSGLGGAYCYNKYDLTRNYPDEYVTGCATDSYAD